MNYLNTDNMILVADVFQGAYEQTLSNLIGDSNTMARRLVAEVVLTYRPYMLVSAEGFEKVQEMVFGHDLNRDFILSLTYTFFARLGQDEDFVKGLASNLARGAAFATKMDLNAIPDAIKGRLGEPKDVAELLEANYWLMVVLMLPLFITAVPEDQRQK